MCDRPHEVSYRGRLYVRPIGRGIILDDAEDRPHLDEWIERALHESGALGDVDIRLGGGDVAHPVTITLRIERGPSP